MSSVGFTGTSTGVTMPQHDALRDTLRQLREQRRALLRHGACKGADRQAHVIWRGLGGLSEYHPGDQQQAHWAFQERYAARGQLSPGETVHPVKPYLARNRDIVRACTRLVACPADSVEILRSGTWATVRYARERQVPLVIITPEGERRFEGDGW